MPIWVKICGLTTRAAVEAAVDVPLLHIGDAVARQYGITVRHDILDEKGKEQRGWRGLRLREEFPKSD